MKGVIRGACVITNSGNVEETGVLQLDIRDLVGSETRPVNELKAFERVTLKPGEKKEVTFSLPVSELAFWDADMKYGVEKGDFLLWINNSSLPSESAAFKVKY